MRVLRDRFAWVCQLSLSTRFSSASITGITSPVVDVSFTLGYVGVIARSQCNSQGGLIGPWGNWVGCRKQKPNATFHRWAVSRRLHRPRSPQRHAAHRGRGNGYLLAALSSRSSPRSGDSGGTAHHHTKRTKRFPRAFAQSHLARPGGTRSAIRHRWTTTVRGSVMRQGWDCHSPPRG